VFKAGHGLGVISSDITERKKAEAALRYHDEVLHTVVDNAPILLWAVDTEHVTTLLMGGGLEKHRSK